MGRAARAWVCAGILGACGGCGSASWLRNGLLDPTQQGNFTSPITLEIRGSLSILDEPLGIQDAEEPTPEDLEVRYEEEPISPGDQLAISIYELLRLEQTTEHRFIVRSSGFETLPEIGPVRVAGLTPRELELEIQEKLRELGILIRGANVQVSVLRSEAQQYSVFGRVPQPGNYPLPRPDFRLLNAVAAFGGVPDETDTIYVFRRTGEEPGPILQETTSPAEAEPEAVVPFTLSDASTGPGVAASQVATEPALKTAPAEGPGIDELAILEGRPQGDQPAPRLDPQTGEWILEEPRTESVPATTQTEPSTLPTTAPEEAPPAEEQIEPDVRLIEIPTKPLLDGDFKYNLVIRPGDTINVPPGIVGEYFVFGNVVRPGAYQLTGRRLTVKQAIASAGGFNPLAWPSRAEVVRRVSNDEEQTIQVDLDAVFAGSAPDFYLRPNDMINVGSSPVATFLAVFRNAFRLSYGFAFVYDRNFADSDSFQAREQVRARRNQEALQRGLPF